MNCISYSRTQQRLLTILGDGEPHAQSELREVCGGISWDVVKVHICYLRKKLRIDPRANGTGRLDVQPFPNEVELMYQLVRVMPISLNLVKTGQNAVYTENMEQ